MSADGALIPLLDRSAVFSEVMFLLQSKQVTQLTAKELAGYRQWLAELDEEAHEPGGDLTAYDADLLQYFAPDQPIGKQVYRSFTDGELLDILIRTMRHHGRRPYYDELYCIYRTYIQLRFKGLTNAKNKARARMKRLEEQRKWPANWYERVSAAPLLNQMKRKGRTASPEDIEFVEALCREIREKQELPCLTQDTRIRIEHMYPCNKALELMGIPNLNKVAQKHLERFWREKQARNATEHSAAGSEQPIQI